MIWPAGSKVLLKLLAQLWITELCCHGLFSMTTCNAIWNDLKPKLLVQCQRFEHTSFLSSSISIRNSEFIAALIRDTGHLVKEMKNYVGWHLSIVTRKKEGQSFGQNVLKALTYLIESDHDSVLVTAIYDLYMKLE